MPNNPIVSSLSASWTLYIYQLASMRRSSDLPVKLQAGLVKVRLSTFLPSSLITFQTDGTGYPSDDFCLSRIELICMSFDVWLNEVFRIFDWVF